MAPIRASLDHCVKCTICETFCPVSNVTPLFPGPKYVGPQAERFRTGNGSPDHSLDYCSGCGICTQVCPQGVKIMEINTRARAQLKQRDGVTVRDRVLARPQLTGRLGAPLAPLANWVISNRPIRRALEGAFGIHSKAPLPRWEGGSFQRWARRHPEPSAAKTVVYFHGCSTNYFEPRVGEMAVRILEHNGYRVVVPPQGCCGLPLQSNGLFDDARSYVRRLVTRLAPYAKAGFDIIGTSTSCTLMLKREAHEILDVNDDDLRLVSENLYDICEYLVALHDDGRLDTNLSALPLTVPYHAPCQQKSHGIGKPALDLFSLIPELRVVELDRECCGIAGTYGVKKEKYDIAMDVGAALFDDVQRSNADVVACDSETCRWQISQASGIGSVHPIELLYRSYGLGRDGEPGS
jgi:glycerol-3-phosphate dehydrogenase subunit C